MVHGLIKAVLTKRDAGKPTPTPSSARISRKLEQNQRSGLGNFVTSEGLLRQQNPQMVSYRVTSFTKSRVYFCEAFCLA